MQGDEAKEGAGSGGPDRLAELQARVEKLSNLFAQLEGARASARRTRAGIMILLLFVVLGFGWKLFNTFSQVMKKDYQQEFMREIGERAEVTVLADAREQVTQLVRKIVPLYLEQLEKQAEEAWPEIQAALQTEAKLLHDNVANEVHAELEPMLTKVAKDQEKRVRDAFNITDKDLDNVMKNLTIALNGAAHGVLKDKFGESSKRLEGITVKVLMLLPEEKREKFHQLTDLFWTNLFLDELKGLEMTRKLTE